MARPRDSFGWHVQRLCDGRGVTLLAEMRKHLGGSAQQHASVFLTSDRTARAEPLSWIAWSDATSSGGTSQRLCDGRGLILLAEMRKHPGGRAQPPAMFASVQTGRLSQEAMSLVRSESSEPILLWGCLGLRP